MKRLKAFETDNHVVDTLMNNDPLVQTWIDEYVGDVREWDGDVITTSDEDGNSASLALILIRSTDDNLFIIYNSLVNVDGAMGIVCIDDIDKPIDDILYDITSEIISHINEDENVVESFESLIYGGYGELHVLFHVS